jgi:hypothetical protein
MSATNLHTFHIPVMGLAYTIDTPLKVARFGISSVISIVQDNLIEKMRSHYYPAMGKTYHPITSKDPDHRARRITDYLNLVQTIVAEQIRVLKAEPFLPGSDICKYFEMLPPSHPLARAYEDMVSMPDVAAKHELQQWLREQICPGSIDVNIMTKVDKENRDASGAVIEDGSDAVAALRGYAESDLCNSTLILSAGMNPRLFNYMSRRTEFDSDDRGVFRKKICLKVSDYRSAFVQGRMLAKKGLWVSEFRIESGLNCGGHAFPTDGYLLGPILEEFRTRKEELTSLLFATYNDALKTKGKRVVEEPHQLRLTVQGGIGTADEDHFLRSYYAMDGTGWGTPFLLVPEATTVDEKTLFQLKQAREEDVILSRKSPLGVRFHYLRNSSAEDERLARIARAIPGSPCTEKYLVSNTEFGSEPLCTASRAYQKKKIQQLESLKLPEAEHRRRYHDIVEKECLCVGLSNSAVKVYGLQPFKKVKGVNICPGPNIAYFNEIVSLQKMVDHIYGRINLLRATDRPHMFLKEVKLYFAYLLECLGEAGEPPDHRTTSYIETFFSNLAEGVAYYRRLADGLTKEWSSVRDKLNEGLIEAEQQLEQLMGKVRSLSSGSRIVPSPKIS